jgi:hypothetical protein
MTSLVDLVDNSRTDKNTCHSYLPLYDNLFSRLREKAVNVLEIGILSGGSIKLWRDYFQNATVHAVDIMPEASLWPGIMNDHRIKLYTSTDAYNPDFFNNTFALPQVKFDMMLDDGPHSLESMKIFILHFSSLLSDDGILVVEDVQSWYWIDELKKVVPDDLKEYVKVYDLRENKGRYDDIVFTIDKN